jgi:glutamyl-Q tRNA(Asp) synthetase
MAVTDTERAFIDRFQGRQTVNLQATGGAFALQRRDGPYSYQLACALDETWLGITHVVRGADLLASTFRQQWILERLGLPVPEYGHLPVLLDDAGHKLSKSEDADPVDTEAPAATLTRALTLLEQQPPPRLAHAPVPTVLEWARGHWDPRPLHGLRQKYASP